MTSNQIDEVVKELFDIANTSSSVSFGGAMVASNPNIFKHSWEVNNVSNYVSDKSVLLEEFEDAVKIISKFSDNQPTQVREDLRKAFSFNESEPLYLHYRKII
jgi:hypothetical protein